MGKTLLYLLALFAVYIVSYWIFGYSIDRFMFTAGPSRPIYGDR